ncbi:4-hydroxy-tetrahydrodipicolinate synthase [Bacteriovorax sp. Seq25_V]|uniref:4-hydroxy-tetrahydrodipicolinate synthase n=1 Tax=Bacteriovorax sp. Seq25_V TaxID=1201288 RepID=UPI00038A0C32|nr:4-hydroxy-tetrahydrodipicolinate synthase [Bacteriovorax sp. Seq25_V]EQC44202.1 dihydrodipicolinate synthase [Bacteriovorax sp. Seq25_V]
MDINSTPLWTAVITPMKENGSVDYDSLERVLQAQDEAGNGILILGSTGEALNIDDDEAKEVLNFAINFKKSVPLMCGIGGINLSRMRAWTEYLNTLAIDCYLVVTPLYAKPGDEGQYQWFKALLDTATKPCMLYNVPGRTGKEMSLAAVERLNTHPNFWAIKEASGSVEKFKAYVKAAGFGRVYSGDDGMLPQYSEHGAKGLVSVASNVWPKQTHLYTKLCLDNKLEDRKLWETAADTLFVSSNPIPVKWIMAHTGQIATPTLRAPLTHLDMVRTEEIIAANEAVCNWYNKNS